MFVVCSSGAVQVPAGHRAHQGGSPGPPGVRCGPVQRPAPGQVGRQTAPPPPPGSVSPGLSAALGERGSGGIPSDYTDGHRTRLADPRRELGNSTNVFLPSHGPRPPPPTAASLPPRWRDPAGDRGHVTCVQDALRTRSDLSGEAAAGRRQRCFGFSQIDSEATDATFCRLAYPPAKLYTHTITHHHTHHHTHCHNHHTHHHTQHMYHHTTPHTHTHHHTHTITHTPSHTHKSR